LITFSCDQAPLKPVMDTTVTLSMSQVDPQKAVSSIP